jgi:alkylhydroperoxidase/carboxymuconolactone decarboxylase family protein YurZ
MRKPTSAILSRKLDVAIVRGLRSHLRVEGSLIWITDAIRDVTDEESRMSESPREISDAPDDELPGTARQVANEKPDLWRAFQNLGAATGAAGPLTEREQRLVNLALALGGDSEGATHSHTRRGLADGLAPQDLEHVAFLAITTLGWPQAIRGLTWIRDVTHKG